MKAEEDRSRLVYMDFTRNPRGYDPSLLSDEAREYLAQCGALQGTPFERLRAINAPAIDLYRSHGIDIGREPLQVSVCAQHHNGGIAVDADWQTDVPGLYVCGEAAGTFGKYRPGGSALNSTQVGSMRAAEHIARRSVRQAAAQGARAELPLLPAGDAASILARLQSDMTRCAAFQRDPEGMREMLRAIGRFQDALIPADPDDPQLIPRLRLRDMMLTQREVLSAMLAGMDPSASAGVLITRNGVSAREAARPIPERDLWFETVWKRYQARTRKDGAR